MANTTDPYAQFDNAPADPYAQFDQPGYAEDMAKAAAPALAKGVIGIAGSGGDLQQIAKAASDKATEKGVNPFAFLADKFENSRLGQFLKESSANPRSGTLFNLGGELGKGKPSFGPSSGDLPGSYALPSTQDIQSKIEEKTGPFYKAQTGPGKALETGLEVAPSLVMGSPFKAALIKATGAGVASELSGEAADAGKGYLPKGAQPWAEPIARAAGAIGGTFTPAGVRRAVTPLPMSDEQHNIVTALRGANPDLVAASTAGQLTESPRLMALEGRLPAAKAGNAAQDAAFTQGAMREAGINGNFTNIHEGEHVGEELGRIRSGHTIDTANLTTLKQDVSREKRDFERVAGRGASPSINEVSDAIKFGAMNNGSPVLSMPGGRYQYMRGDLQTRIDAAKSPAEKEALSNIKRHMDQAFYRAAGDDTAEHLQELQRQYANYNVLRNVPPKIGRENVNPQEVLSAVGKNWGNAAANESRGLAPYAQNSARVMTPHGEMPDKTKVPASIDLLISALGGTLGHAGTEGTVAGHLLAPSIYHGAADMAARGASSTPVQAYLANQAWRPGSNSFVPDREELLRLLLTSQATQISGQ